jgi:hypothetical protein
MALFEDLKSVAKIFQEAGKIDLYEKILSIQQELLDMQENLRLKDETIRELNKELKLKGEMSFERNAFWRTQPNGDLEGPYCPGCWGDKGKLVHMVERSADIVKCPACKTIITLTQI